MIDADHLRRLIGDWFEVLVVVQAALTAGQSVSGLLKFQEALQTQTAYISIVVSLRMVVFIFSLNVNY